MYVGLHVNCQFFLSDFNENRIFSKKIFEKIPNVKLHENPSSVSRIAPSGQRGRQAGKQTNRQKRRSKRPLFVIFRKRLKRFDN